MCSLADRIADSVFAAYDKLGPACKPGIRSNGVKEWTVLASIVAIDYAQDVIRVVSLGTGVKATPDTELVRSGGKILHDCHAEVLSLRAFNSTLLKEAILIKEGFKSDLLELGEHGFMMRSNWKLGLYISRLPCGDASMNLLEEQDDIENASSIYGDYGEKQFIDPAIKTILRGRTNYDAKGVVRTKPGRLDSKITLSKSCSDKLAMKQITSILNSMTWSIFASPVYLDYIILPDTYVSHLGNLKRSFHERLSKSQAHLFTFLFCKSLFDDDKYNSNQEPSLTSSSVLYCSDEIISEAIQNGVKSGFYVKSKKPLRKNCQATISRYGQWIDYHNFNDTPRLDYYSFKSALVERSQLVGNTKLLLSPDGWLPTFKDTFC